MDPAPIPASLGEFRIASVLGEGGSGVVYDATWGPRRVALKVLHRDLAGTSQFLGEAQRLQAIAHPAVVKVFAVGQLPDGRPYLAMERLEGETLASAVARGPWPLAPAIELFAELCSAVTALHDQGLVHRDLKPENVFVVAGRHAVLLDFGIAKDLAAPASTTTQEGRVRGTPAYMAPERFFGQPAGIATDIYELALVLYVMLAGRVPWDELGDPEARLSPRPLTSVPDALDVEIRRALSTRAQNRPASAAALLAAVREAASDLATSPEAGETARLSPARSAGDRAPTPQQTPLAWAPTQAAPSRSTPRRTRARWIAGFAAVAAIAVATFAWRHQRAPASPRTAVSAPVVAAPATPGANDPWNAPPRPPPPAVTLPLVEPAATPKTYRAEAAAAIQHLPADTRVVFSVQIDELRKQPQMADLLGKIAKHPKVVLLASVLPPCMLALVANAEWVVVGAATLGATDQGTFVMRGRWRRSDVEACFAGSIETHTARDGTKLYKIKGDGGWLDFIDDHTAYGTLTDGLDADAVHALARHGAGPIAHVHDILARLPADRSIALVIDGHGYQDLSDLVAMPKGSDLSGWIRVARDGLSLDFAGDPHDEDAARAAETALRPRVEDMFGVARTDAVGRLAVVRDKTVVHVRGNLTAAMLGLITAGVSL